VIVSHRHRFVFLKGMKVAGTSVEMALAPLCGPDDIVTPVSPIDERARGGLCRNYAGDRAVEVDYLERLRATRAEDLPALQQPPLVFYNHMPLTEVLAKTGPLDGYRILAVERSPYAKVISWANMRLTYGAYRTGGAMRADPAALGAYIDKGLETGAIAAARNIDRYRRADGTLAVRPWRYAELGAAFDAFVRGLGLEPPPLPHAKKGLLSDSLDPRTILTATRIARINTLFAAEFEAFGYERI
jgi:hypothetical protein